MVLQSSAESSMLEVIKTLQWKILYIILQNTHWAFNALKSPVEMVYVPTFAHHKVGFFIVCVFSNP